MSDRLGIHELKEAIREFLSSAEKHGQIYDLVPFSTMASILKILDEKMGTRYYNFIIDVYITLSRSAPTWFDTYILKSIKYIAEGLQYKAEIISQARKKTPIIG